MYKKLPRKSAFNQFQLNDDPVQNNLIRVLPSTSINVCMRICSESVSDGFCDAMPTVTNNGDPTVSVTEF